MRAVVADLDARVLALVVELVPDIELPPRVLDPTCSSWTSPEAARPPADTQQSKGPRPAISFGADLYTRRDAETYSAYMSEPRSESRGNSSANLETDPRTNGGPEGGEAPERAVVPPPQANRGPEPSGPRAEDPPIRRADASKDADPAGDADLPPPHIKLPVKETKSSWREHALTRIEELDDYVDQLVADGDILPRAAARARRHLQAAQGTAQDKKGDPLKQRLANSVHVERVMSHIDAAEAFILRSAPLEHVAAQVPAILNHVRNHLARDNVLREQAEAIGAAMREQGKTKLRNDVELDERERGILVAAMRAASEEERREIMRVRSFRNVLFVSGLLVAMLVVVLGFLGAIFYQDVDVCFNPVEASGGGKIVCPLNETSYEGQPGNLDQLTNDTATPWDVPAILILGASAAALSAAIALRQVQGSSTPYSLPVALAVLKLPTGALTALLGLLLMRGQFIPGFSALDFPAQVLAWAVILGYAQQLLTRLLDQRAQMVLKAVGTPPKNDPQPG